MRQHGFYRSNPRQRQRAGMLRRALTLAALLACATGCQPARLGSSATRTTLITNVTVIDGSGASGRPMHVRVTGDRISDTWNGELRATSRDTVIDGRGMVLAPGFIDTHSHAAGSLNLHRDALAAVSQGITTLVGGQDGSSIYPLDSFFTQLEHQPAAVNVAAYSGHGTLRELVLGGVFRRHATDAEVDSMARLLERDMDAGAIGLSTGLEYDPGIYSDTAEVLALARIAAHRGGRYISHIRSEDRYFWKAIDEIIAIGRRAAIPVQVSHVKLAMRSLWGKADSLIGVLDRARATGVDITADIYPYTYWQSTLTVLFPERDFENRETASFVLREISAPEGLLMAHFAPDSTYVGKTVAEISTLRQTDPVMTLIDMIRESQASEKLTGRSAESVIGTSMIEADVERLMAWPYANICTDGGLAGRHPRGFGSFPRVLGRYVRERKIMKLEEAVRKMTSLPAHSMGVTDRGVIAKGNFADLVLFDPATVLDRATPTEPQAVSSGISRVWVNGVVVYEAGKPTGNLPGRVVRRASPR